jgi:hypothetical protein
MKIKYRIWDTKSKQYLTEIPALEEWLNAFLRDPYAAFDDSEQLLEDPFLPCPYPEDFRGRLSYELFTGVKDVDGKEIYENDIVKVIGGMPNEMTIVWSESRGAFGLIETKAACFGNFYLPNQPMKIVGNINVR